MEPTEETTRIEAEKLSSEFDDLLRAYLLAYINLQEFLKKPGMEVIKQGLTHLNLP